jgi:hypothetical protein
MACSSKSSEEAPKNYGVRGKSLLRYLLSLGLRHNVWRQCMRDVNNTSRVGRQISSLCFVVCVHCMRCDMFVICGVLENSLSSTIPFHPSTGVTFGLIFVS